MRTSRCLVALIALAATIAPLSSAFAGKPHTREGFFIGFGLGAGNAAWDWKDSDFGSGPSEGSGTGNFRIGGALKENLVLGLESSAWVKKWDLVSGGVDAGELSVTLSAATLGVTVFPSNMGFFVRGGLGLATAKIELTTAGTFIVGTAESTDSGIAFLAATGYEWRLTDKFALGPQLELVWLGIDGDLFDNGIIVDGGLELNWYW